MEVCETFLKLTGCESSNTHTLTPSGVRHGLERFVQVEIHDTDIQTDAPPLRGEVGVQAEVFLPSASVCLQTELAARLGQETGRLLQAGTQTLSPETGDCGIQSVRPKRDVSEEVF